MRILDIRISVCFAIIAMSLCIKTHGNDADAGALLDHSTDWMGHTFSGAGPIINSEADGKWLQVFVSAMQIDYNGLVLCNSHWDEGGPKRSAGVYSEADGEPLGFLRWDGNHSVMGDAIAVYSTSSVTHIYTSQILNNDGVVLSGNLPIHHHVLESIPDEFNTDGLYPDQSYNIDYSPMSMSVNAKVQKRGHYTFFYSQYQFLTTAIIHYISLDLLAMNSAPFRHHFQSSLPRAPARHFSLELF